MYVYTCTCTCIYLRVFIGSISPAIRQVPVALEHLAQDWVVGLLRYGTLYHSNSNNMNVILTLILCLISESFLPQKFPTIYTVYIVDYKNCTHMYIVYIVTFRAAWKAEQKYLAMAIILSLGSLLSGMLQEKYMYM